jgi:Protein of unknown function (DUF4238)
MSYHDNHISSRFYLAAWAGPDGLLCAVELPGLKSVPKSPKRVGYRIDFWGADAQVREASEKSLMNVENDGARALRQLLARWPLPRKTDPWRAVALVVAIHILRNPAGKRLIERSQRTVLDRNVPRYTERWGAAETEFFLRYVTSDGFRADVLLRNIPVLAAVVGNMDWTLVEFSDSVLATSDHPVTVVPILRDGEQAPVTPIPDRFVLECEEIRFPIGPRHALLFTWSDGTRDGIRVRGDDGMAAELNRAVTAQADTQWFHHPSRRPTTFAAPFLQPRTCSAIGRALLPGYGWERALVSRRRIATAAMIDQDLNEGRAAA